MLAFLNRKVIMQIYIYNPAEGVRTCGNGQKKQFIAKELV